MKRYQFNQTKITDKFNKRTKKVYGTIIYPKIERHVEDFYIDVLVEDRLDNLAYQYYEDVTLWWIIANANKLDRASNYGITQKMDKGIGKGSMFVEPGQRIRIPNPRRISAIVDEYQRMLEERTYFRPEVEEPLGPTTEGMPGNSGPTNMSSGDSTGGGMGGGTGGSGGGGY